MKFFVHSVFLPSFFAIALAYAHMALPTSALAKDATLEIENTTAFSIDIALVYMKDKRSEPINRGWYVVNPRSKTTITLNTDREKIFWYGKTDAGWYWGGDSNNKEDATFDIYEDKYSVQAGKKIKDKQAVAVRFKAITRQKDSFHLKLVD